MGCESGLPFGVYFDLNGGLNLTRKDRTSGPFSGVLVVSEDLATPNYDFGSVAPVLAGISGDKSGKIVWNPVFVAAREGETLWYSSRNFDPKSLGVVGSVLDSLYISPVPSPLERPILRIGNRAPLTVISVENETALAALSVPSGSVGVALSTGEVKLNDADRAKADPNDSHHPSRFDPLYLGAVLRYDGVALNRYPQPLRAPVLAPLSGDYYQIPAAASFPGTGTSGIVLVPDGTGNVPDASLSSGFRPGDSGLVRRLTPGFGDAFLFTDSGRVAKIAEVNRDADFPSDPYAMPLDTAYVSLDTGNVAVGSSLAESLDGKDVYFGQALLTPSLYPDGPRVFSRIRDSFTFAGGENLAFRVDGTNWSFATSAGTFTADAVASLFNAVIGRNFTAGTVSGYLYISSNLSNGVVSIGFDETGCKALGFGPGWYVSDPATGSSNGSDPNWLPDSGVSFGLSRSPSDLDGSLGYPDVRATSRITDATLSESVAAVPYQLLNYAPREDIAGYDSGVFFALSGTSSPASVKVQTTLLPYTDVLYQFEKSRFGWASKFSFSGRVLSPVSSIDLGVSGVIGETFYSAMGGYLRVAAGGGAVESLSLETDFLVPDGSGTAILIDRVGPRIQSGYRGSVSGSVLTDTSVTITASAGDRLKVTSGSSPGSYLVSTSSSHNLTVTPAFPAPSSGNVSWELYQGVSPGTIDPSILADVVYEDFNPLPSEPFEVRILTSLGVAGGSLSSVGLPVANSGRTLGARFAKDGADIALTLLGSSDLGTIANGALYVPISGARYTSGKFSLVLGSRVFVNGTDLLEVPNFSSPISSGVIEYRTGDGQLRFGASVLSGYPSVSVVYREEVLAAADIPSGTGELSPFTGAVGLNATDLSTNAGKTVYLSDLQTHLDVYLNPILGAFSFRRPVSAGQLVEATYFRAIPDSGELYRDTSGTPVLIRELLPVFIRRETATRVTSQVYSFNAAGKTTDPDVAPSVYVGPKLVSYGLPVGVSVDFSGNTFFLADAVPDPATRVLISYAVYEATGGETTYTVSSGPVWRPPFYLTAKSSNFVLATNRTSDVVAGKVLRLDNYLCYIRSVTYDGATDKTSVEIFPAPEKNVGTLSPSEPPSNLLTDRPVTPYVDPAGVTPVTTGADAGFLPELSTAYGLSAVPRFDKVSVGASSIRFDGDLTRYAVAGHVLELFGIPFLVAKSEFVDGKYTTINLGTSAPVEMSWSSGMNPRFVRISVRPIYPVGSMGFLGAGAFVATEPYEVVSFEGLNPGDTLVEGRDYQLDATAGTISLLSPRQSGIAAQSSLRFYRTNQKSLAPFSYGGTLLYPLVGASAGYLDPPSTANGRLGSILTATYTFDSPDSFYVRSLPLPSYISETSASLLRGVAKNATGNNPSTGAYGSRTPSTQGSTGLTSERQDLVSKDRVARAFLRYYNGIVTSFEQTLETLSGNPIGDRDGKFRFWVGAGDPWTPPGYEDGITSGMNARNVWADVWGSYLVFPIHLLTSDPVTDPTSTSLVSDDVTGPALSSAALGTLSSLQHRAIRNDVDDVVLTGLTGTTVSLAGILRFRVTSYGIYRGLSEPSAYSRIYPERTFAFTTTDPGIGYDPINGDNGVYSYGKLELDLFGKPPSIDIASTNGEPVARLSNPVRGNFKNVLGAVVQNRRARARILSYSPTGFPGITSRPSFLATVLTVDRFPLRTDGTPDTSRLASVSGNPADLYDLSTGDPSLHTPPFVPGDQLSLGNPDGTTYGLGYATSPFTLPDGSLTYPGLFVDAVLSGCVVTLKTYDGTSGNPYSIYDPSLVVRLTSGITGSPLSAGLGDTLYVVPPTGSSAHGFSDPPTTAQLEAYGTALPAYRVGTDVDLNGTTGELVDATLPSWKDPAILGIKEIIGQRPPAPVSRLQASVSFQNGDTTPSNIPALRGQSRMDSGDFSLPYYGITPTELSVLGDVLPGGIDLIALDSPDPPVDTPLAGHPSYAVEAVYPDEVLGGDAAVSSSDPTNPAALTTAATLDPTFTAHSGVGTAQPFDLLFVQEGSGTLPAGATGIHSIATATPGTPGTPSVIEPPRFISRNNRGDSTSLEIDCAQTLFDGTHATGIRVTEVVNPFSGAAVTSFELHGVTDIVFDDGMGGGVLPTPTGGFNDFFVGGSSSVPTRFYLRILDPSTGNYASGAGVVLELQTTGADITLCRFRVSGDGGSTFISNGLATFETSKLTVTTSAPFFNFTPYPHTNPVPFTTDTTGLLDFVDDLSSESSRNFFYEADRLTISGPVDLRTARPKGSTTPGGNDAQCSFRPFGGNIYVYDTNSSTFIEVRTSVNSVSEINGSVAFTFSSRTGLSPSSYGVGTFSSGTGSLKVMAFEGWGNAAINSSAFTFSAVPSSRQDETGAILGGYAISDRYSNFAPGSYIPSWENRFAVSTEVVGAASRVLPGDVLVVKSVLEDPAASIPVLHGKAGTHLVRGVIASSGPVEERRETYATPNTNGDYNGWLPFTFPTVKAASSTILMASTLTAFPSLLDWNGTSVSQGYEFPSSGRVFVIVDEAGLNSTDGPTFAASIVSAAYSSVSPSGSIFNGLSDFKNGLGSAITGAAFASAAATGKKVSGMTLLPVNPHSSTIPENLPGFTNVDLSRGPYSVYGFRSLTLSRGAATVSFVASASGNLLPSVASPTTVYVYRKARYTSEAFRPLDAAVYDEIPGAVSVSFAASEWDTLHTPSGAGFTPTGAHCFLPGDGWSVDYSGAAGIYVEPSFPRTANNLASASMNAVDAGHSLTTGTVGVRKLSSYALDAPALGAEFVEYAEIEVRRPRRFHEVSSTFSERLQDLRYCYEIRRGIVSSVTNSGGYSVLTAAPVDGSVPPVSSSGGAATQLGNFSSKLVNVNPGDEVRFLDTNGLVTARAEVTKIAGDFTLYLSRRLSVSPGTSFEVYLRTAPVPQEQSNEELLGYVTDKVIISRRANYTTEQGGRVPTTNELRDTDGTVDYAAAGVARGDVIIVDPAGKVRGPTGYANPVQSGRRPFGDNGVSTRPSSYTAGGPTKADDNRGYYLVTGTATDHLSVSAIGNLAGNLGSDVILGTGSHQYTVYPTVHASGLTSGAEGQADLRPTHLSVANSYTTNYYSIEPFSYRVIRPSKLLSTKTLELILAMRERMLSWAEEIRSVRFKYGTYFVFQRDEHLRDLGTETDTESGLGLLTNAYLEGIVGRWDVSPFVNVSDGLSVLDRRFWGLDFRLDSLTPPYGISSTPYADFTHKEGRPVLPDRIGEALDGRDRLRATRFSWLSIRTNRINGTLESIRRFDNELPKRKAETEQAIIAVQSVEKVQS